MPVEAPIDAAGEVRPLTLRRNFAWTFAGNALYGASQWAVLSLIAKLGDTAMLGQYALAIAVAGPLSMFSHLNLRAVLATDVERRHPFGDYIAVRLGITALTLAAIAAIAFASGYRWPVPLLVLLAGIALSSENVSDIFYGAMQRRERMDQIARSMVVRGFVSAAALGLALWLTRSIITATAAMALARIAVLIAYDRPLGSTGEDLSHSGVREHARLFRTALPLGIVLMLVSLNTNLPRYAIERHLGTRELGAFTAVASFIAMGSTIVNALGQSATPRLARYFSSGDLRRFRKLWFGLSGIALLVGLAGVAGSLVCGRLVLRLLYRAELEPYAAVLTAVMAAAILVYLAIAMGFVVTSAREFAPQLPLLCAAAASCAAASWLLVPQRGLTGAAWALAIAASVQIGGQLWIVRRAIRRQSRRRLAL